MKFAITKGKDGLYYWHEINNGRITSDGGEGYSRRSEAKRAYVRDIERKLDRFGHLAALEGTERRDALREEIEDMLKAS